LETESDHRYRNYKELVHMACIINLISQLSLDFASIRIPVISNEYKEHTASGAAHTKGHRDAAIQILVKEQTFSKYYD
jgi:hypothetical protein